MRRLLIPAALAVVLGLAAQVHAQSDPKAVLDKAVKAHGGEKIKKITGSQTRSKGTLDAFGGAAFTQESVVQFPDKVKEVMNIDVNGQKIAVTSVYNGKQGWIKVNDMVMDMTDQILNEVKESLYLMKAARLAMVNDPDVTLAPLGESSVNNKPAVGVKVSVKGHKDINLFFDKETGLLAKSERRGTDVQTGKEVDEERIITEYQDAAGMKVAKKLTVNRDGKKFMEVEVLEVSYPDKVDDAEFAKP